MEYNKIVELGESADGTYAFKDENDRLLSAVSIPNSVDKPFVHFYLEALGDDAWRRKVSMIIETVDGYTYAYPNIRRIPFCIYYFANIVSNTNNDKTTMLKYYEWDMKFNNVTLGDSSTNFNFPLVYNQTLAFRKTTTSVTINNVEVPDKLKNGEWCHFKLVEKVITSNNQSTCDLYIDDELFLEDAYVYQGHYNNDPNIIAYINLYGLYEDNPFDLSTDPCVLTANLKIYHQDTEPRKPMIKIIPKFGLNEVELSYECIFDNATEVSHEWSDENGLSYGNGDTITVYENGIYSLTVTDSNGNSNTSTYVNTATIFDTGCGDIPLMGNGIGYFPDEWDFDRWKFDFDFTATINEQKPMFYIEYNEERLFEFGATHCKKISTEETVTFGDQYIGEQHHGEIEVDTVNETLIVRIDGEIKCTFDEMFLFPNWIYFETQYNGFKGISYNFKLDNLKIYKYNDNEE